MTIIEGTQKDSVVAIYDSHTGAEAAVRALHHAGLDMKQLSIIGKDFQSEEHALGFYTSGDRMKFWGSRSAFWGSLWGMLFGGALFFIPGIGPLVALGPVVGWLAGALEGAALGGAAGVLAAALTSIDIPKDSVIKYELAVKAGKFVVLAHGDAAMIVHARAVLEATPVALLEAHRRQEQRAREDILNLLSDAEVAKVSTAETAASLTDGDEYLDLERLELGVRKALGKQPMSRVLPRKAVQAETWRKILTRLPATDGARIGL